MPRRKRRELSKAEIDAFMMTIKLTGDTLYATGRVHMCAESKLTTGFGKTFMRICTRQRGHDGPHLSHDFDGKPFSEPWK